MGTDGSVIPGSDGGVGGTASPCGPYPTAPALTATRFELGSVVPNLSFTKEDGKTITFADIRCNKQNKLMYWAVGGDNCGPCVANAKTTEIPAWRELGPKGLMMVESFNGNGFLVSASPWVGWRRKTMWPADDDHILVVAEPKTPPWYVMARVYNGIPWVAIIELETMKVMNKSRGTVASLTTLLNATAERPK